jgi:hypothetical protein
VSLREDLEAELRPFICHPSHTGRALDAILDYLEANADEWIESERQMSIQRMARSEGYHGDVATMKPVAQSYAVLQLVAALRNEENQP